MSDAEWPVLDDAAFYGLPGEVVAATEYHTEADPAALLVTFLAAAGCYLPSGKSHAGFPHVWIGDTEHPPRIWPVLVGATADGRKGTADAIIRRILGVACPDFLNGNVESGLTSGSGLIERVRDPSGDDVPAKQQHPGVTDKRLLVVEHEFGGTLRRAARDGNDLSERLREAWDGRPLLTMSRSVNRMRSTGHHIVVLGHITPGELRVRYQESTDVVGGTANRLLPVLVRRARRLPDGGGVPDDAIAVAGKKLAEVRDTGRKALRYTRDDVADAWWSGELYNELTPDNVPEGYVAKMLARAAPQVMRIALIYCLLDQAAEISAQHLEAAMAVWRYSLASVEHIFGSRGDPDLETLAEAVDSVAEGLTGTGIRDLFNRHKSAAEIRELTSALIATGNYDTFTEQTGGRPVTYLRRISDESD